MVKEYTCDKCGKVFSQKGHYNSHLNRKNPCKSIKNTIIEEKVQEKLQELSENGDIEIINKNLILNNNNNNNNMEISKKNMPKPLLKWVGGKGQLIEIILKKFPKEFNNYHEMFLGGGSVLLATLWAKNNGYIKINGSINVYDLNESLINTYLNIKNYKDELYDKLSILIETYNVCELEGDVHRKPIDENEGKTSKESYYYWIRKKYNELQSKKCVQSSAYFIFLNKTGFRGMYREGPNGFNIPYGAYKNPGIIYKKHLEEISELIQDVNFIHSSFDNSFANIKQEDFCYLDPPYAPENDKSFVGYTKEGFDIGQHIKLFNLIKKSSEYSSFMMSNSNVQLVKDNLSTDIYDYEYVNARRAINSKDPSAMTKEVIIVNY